MFFFPHSSDSRNRKWISCSCRVNVLLLPYFQLFCHNYVLPLPSDELFLCNSEPYFIGCLYCFLISLLSRFPLDFPLPSLTLPIPTSPGPRLQTRPKSKEKIFSRHCRTKFKGPLQCLHEKQVGGSSPALLSSDHFPFIPLLS